MTRRSALSLALLLLCAFAPSLAAAQDPPLPAGRQASPSHEAVTTRVAEARRMLDRAAIGTSRIGGDNAVLALWNPADPGAGIRLAQLRNGVSRTRGVSVDVLVRNGVNSRYRVTAPEGWRVLAIRTNVRTGRRSAGPVVYVPYDEALDTPETRSEGRAYLRDLIASAGRRLADRHVGSCAVDGCRIAEVVPPRVMMTLMLIEHIDPDDFASIGAERMTGRVFTVIALNRGNAYRHAGSYAGALGLAQFIRGTYALTRARYPGAGLPADFRQGMGDHLHAAVAQQCLADWSLTRLDEATLRRLREPAHEEDLGAWLAAAYNGGEDRAARALREHPTDWELQGNGLATQTVGYVREFRIVHRLLGD